MTVYRLKTTYISVQSMAARQQYNCGSLLARSHIALSHYHRVQATASCTDNPSYHSHSTAYISAVHTYKSLYQATHTSVQMANNNLTFKKIVNKLSAPDAYQRLRSSNYDDAIPLLRAEPRDPPPYSQEDPQQEVPVYTSFRDEQAEEQQRREKILCTADRLAVGMGLEYKKREVILKRSSSSAGTGESAYKRAGGGGRSGSRKN